MSPINRYDRYHADIKNSACCRNCQQKDNEGGIKGHAKSWLKQMEIYLLMLFCTIHVFFSPKHGKDNLLYSHYKY